MMSTEEKPLPCPFCGKSPMMHDIAPHAHAISLGDWTMPDHLGSTVIECGCGAGMIDETRAEVLARWNRRVTPCANMPASRRKLIEEAGRRAMRAVFGSR